MQRMPTADRLRRMRGQPLREIMFDSPLLRFSRFIQVDGLALQLTLQGTKYYKDDGSLRFGFDFHGTVPGGKSTP